MKRLALIVGVGVILAGCGGARATTSVVLKPTNPLLANLYVQVQAPSGASQAITHSLSQEGGGAGAFVAAPAVKGQKNCSRAIQIETFPVTVPSLRKFAGQKFTIAVYGKSNQAPAVCQALSGGFGNGFPLVGGDNNVYRIPASSMEPTLHCARKSGLGCLGRVDDLVVARLTGAKNVQRRDIVVFNTPSRAAIACGAGGTFVKRVIGLSGETVHEDDHGFIWIRGPSDKKFVKLNEPYLSASRRLQDSAHFGQTWKVPPDEYFLVGDNRAYSCDSRSWGAVPARSIIGPVDQIIRGGSTLKPAGAP